MSRKFFILGLLGLGLILQACGKGPNLSDLDYSVIGISNETAGNSSSADAIIKKARNAVIQNLKKLKDGNYQEVKDNLSMEEQKLRSIAHREGWIDNYGAALGGDTVFTSDYAKKGSCSGEIGSSEKSGIFEGLERQYHEHYFEARTILGKLQALHAIAKYKTYTMDEQLLTSTLAKSLIFFVAGEERTVASTALYTIGEDNSQADDFYNRLVKIDGVRNAILNGAQDLGYGVWNSGDGVEIFSEIVEEYKRKNCAER